jgi:hypothetical protein
MNIQELNKEIEDEYLNVENHFCKNALEYKTSNFHNYKECIDWNDYFYNFSNIVEEERNHLVNILTKKKINKYNDDAIFIQFNETNVSDYQSIEEISKNIFEKNNLLVENNKLEIVNKKIQNIFRMEFSDQILCFNAKINRLIENINNKKNSLITNEKQEIFKLLYDEFNEKRIYIENKYNEIIQKKIKDKKYDYDDTQLILLNKMYMKYCTISKYCCHNFIDCEKYNKSFIKDDYDTYEDYEYDNYEHKIEMNLLKDYSSREIEDIFLTYYYKLNIHFIHKYSYYYYAEVKICEKCKIVCIKCPQKKYEEFFEIDKRNHVEFLPRDHNYDDYCYIYPNNFN